MTGSTLPHLKETPSQTAGPYVHIGLIPHQAGFDIFANNFSNVLVAPETLGQRITIEGRVFDGAGSLCREPDSACAVACRLQACTGGWPWPFRSRPPSLWAMSIAPRLGRAAHRPCPYLPERCSQARFGSL